MKVKGERVGFERLKTVLALLSIVLIVVVAWLVAWVWVLTMSEPEPEIECMQTCYNLECVDVDVEGFPDGVDITVVFKITADYERFEIDYNLTLRSGHHYEETRMFQVPEGYVFGERLGYTLHFPILEDIKELKVRIHSCS